MLDLQSERDGTRIESGRSAATGGTRPLPSPRRRAAQPGRQNPPQEATMGAACRRRRARYKVFESSLKSDQVK